MITSHLVTALKKLELGFNHELTALPAGLLAPAGLWMLAGLE